MQTREFPVLSSEDQGVINRLTLGLGEDAARALAYLILRSEREGFEDHTATLPELRLGTGLNRSAALQALETLADRELVEQSKRRTGTQGRPPSAWRPSYDRAESIGRVDGAHADELLECATQFLDVDRSDDLSQPPPEGGDGDDANRTVALALNWRPNGLHAPLYAAMRTDYFADSRHSVGIDENEGSREALDAVVNGGAEFGIVGAATIVRARAAGASIVPVALLYQRAMTVLYTARERFDDPLDSVLQLRGCTVGMPIESEAGVLGRLFLSHGGVLDDVELIDLSSEESRALRSGAVDVVTGSFADPLRLEADGCEVHTFPVADHFPLYGLALVTREDTLFNRSRTVRELLRAVIAGWATARGRPDDVPWTLLDAGDGSVSHERRVFRRAVREFGHSEAVRKHGWGWHEVEEWSRLETALDQAELLEENRHDRR